MICPIPDPVELASRLIKIDTCNPPGNEQALADLLEPLLVEAGFAVQRHDMSPGRCSLVARLNWGPEPPLLMTGHLDTVPQGSQPWRLNPFGGEVADGRLHGRGASDMKSGLAAMTVAAMGLAADPPSMAGLVLVFTASEENGCQGAELLVQTPEVLGDAGAILVAEPTDNQPMLGHKGALWLKCCFQGLAAHGSRPDLGDNAIYKAVDAVARLASHELSAPDHPILGQATLNVGTIKGGQATNLVPDSAEFTVDVRLTPGFSPDQAEAEVADLLGDEVSLERIIGAGALWTESGDPWIERVLDLLTPEQSTRPQPGAVSYFTDGAALSRALGDPPCLILGPGEPGKAHVVNEDCTVDNIRRAAEYYLLIARDWCDGA